MARIYEPTANELEEFMGETHTWIMLEGSVVCPSCGRSMALTWWRRFFVSWCECGCSVWEVE